MPSMSQAGCLFGGGALLEGHCRDLDRRGAGCGPKMKETPVNDFFAQGGKIREDGRMVHDMYLVQVKAPQESKYPWDYYKVVRTVSGDRAFRPLSESECPLVKKWMTRRWSTTASRASLRWSSAARAGSAFLCYGAGGGGCAGHRQRPDAARSARLSRRVSAGATYHPGRHRQGGRAPGAVQGGVGARARVDPGDQCRRAAARPVSRCHAGRLARRLRDQRLRRRRDGALLPARHDRAEVRPHRQHHLVRGERALSEHGAVQHGSDRADRCSSLAGPRSDRARRHREQHLARA